MRCSSRARRASLEVHVGQRRVVRPAGRDHHVVDRSRQARRRSRRGQPSRWRRRPPCSARRARSRRCCRRSGLRPVRMTSAPSARARRAVSSPMPALPPITTTVWPSSSGSRPVGWATSCGAHRLSLLVRPPSAVSRPRRRPGRCRDLAAERLQRVDVDLREGRERLDRVAQHVERDAGADRQRRLLQPLARLGAERVGAGQPLAVAEQRQEAVLLGVRARVRRGLRHAPTAGAVALKRPAVAPTAAACGSV